MSKWKEEYQKFSDVLLEEVEYLQREVARDKLRYGGEDVIYMISSTNLATVERLLKICKRWEDE